jgi:hypothetical protein
MQGNYEESHSLMAEPLRAGSSRTRPSSSKRIDDGQGYNYHHQEIMPPAPPQVQGWMNAGSAVNSS